MSNGPELRIRELKPFVPARDVALSVRFYEALGFTAVRAFGDVTLLRHGSTGFLLQDFHVEDLARNLVLHLLIDDAAAWHAHAREVAMRFGTELGPLQEQPWGQRDFTLTDPSGVLWRIGQLR